MFNHKNGIFHFKIRIVKDYYRLNFCLTMLTREILEAIFQRHLKCFGDHSGDAKKW